MEKNEEIEVLETLRKRVKFLEQNLSDLTKLLGDNIRSQQWSHQEIQWNRNYVDTKSVEIIKDRIEHSREQRNCVIWDLELESLRKYSNLESDNEVTVAFAYDFIQKYLGPFDKRDFRMKRLNVDDEKKKKTYFRLMVTFKDVSNAQRLIGNCIQRGFKKIRSGFTKMERDLMFQTRKKVEELNSNLGPNSDYRYIRKNMYDIVKVHRSDFNLDVRKLESSQSSTPEMTHSPVIDQTKNGDHSVERKYSVKNDKNIRKPRLKSYLNVSANSGLISHKSDRKRTLRSHSKTVR